MQQDQDQKIGNLHSASKIIKQRQPRTADHKFRNQDISFILQPAVYEDDSILKSNFY